MIRFKSLLATALLATSLLFSGCSTTTTTSTDGATVSWFRTKAAPSTADIQQYNTIGVEFLKYSAQDDRADKTADAAIAARWEQEGSDKVVYDYIAPRYNDYVKADKKLTTMQREIRLDNLSAWRIRLEGAK